ncbi:MAG: 3-methyl-2-oxobutanoate hydroxymethyltransferase [Planctomycetota bacterium]|nr:MAG: 3-methyl-2-oxobutanoate hydroxymethyltransferase [Planctomycetota bacterium]
MASPSKKPSPDRTRPRTSEEPVPSKITAPGIRARKGSGRKILSVTAYDYPSARLVDEAGFDVILVGDSMANVVLGHASTLKITLPQMISATRAVKRGADRPLVVADMPFGSYHVSRSDTLRNALRLVREGGAEAVKLEGGRSRADMVAALVQADIPVMGHVGLLPQSIHTRGGYKVRGRTMEDARELLADARSLEAAGAFAVVLEGVPAAVAERISQRLKIPTIGIGAGAGCDGQILVLHDVIGLSFGPTPRFARRYANVAEVMREALQRFAEDIRKGRFPAESETYQVEEALPADWDRSA